MTRLTNPELVQALRDKLTKGFYVDPDAVKNRDGILAATKPWRNDMWKLLNEVDARMNPKPPSKEKANED
jgi:hypothetical protein